MSIGVVVPIHNVEKWLCDCLNSLISQTVPFDEIILIDDGSTDLSGQIADEYVERCDFIRVFHQPNKGLGATRNIGLNHVHSQYVLFVDSDDYLREDACEVLKTRLAEAKEKEMVDAVYFDAAVISDSPEHDVSKESASYVRNIVLEDKIISGKEFFELSCAHVYIPTAWACLYKTEILSEIEFPENVYYEDNYTSLAYMLTCKHVDCISEKLYFYRIRNGSIMTSSFTNRKFDDYYTVISKMFSYLIDNAEKIVCVKESIFGYATTRVIRVFKLHNKLCESVKDIDNKNGGKCRELAAILEKYLLLTEVLNITINENAIENLLKIVLLFTDMDCSIPVVGEICAPYERLQLMLKNYYCELFSLYDIRWADSEKKYGIYGIGKHTDGLIRYVNKHVCTINAKIEYYVSELGNDDYYNGDEVKSIKELDKGLDAIIISSFPYGNEMKKRLKEMGNTVRLVWFYEIEGSDIFSWFAS